MRRDVATVALAAGACTLAAVVAGSDGLAGTGSRTPPVLAVVGKDPHAKLVALDPRTLKRLASPRPLGTRRCPSTPCRGEFVGPVLSPDGRRVAVVGPRGIDVIGRWKLRGLRTVVGVGAVPDVVSAPMAWAGRAFIFAGSGKFGLAMYYVGSLAADTDIGGTEVRARDGWAVISNEWASIPPPTSGGVTVTSFAESGDRGGVGLALSAAVPSVAAYDAQRDRLFVVSSTGASAVVDMRTLGVSYRTLQLPSEAVGRSSTLMWAGRSRLVLWNGESRAWSIDTRGGPPRAVDPTATGVRVSTGSIVTWNRAAATGVRIYEPDGDLRFDLFPSRRVSEVAVTARYAYVDAEGRYSVDLRTGAVSGPLRNRARLVVPDLLRLP